MFIEFNDVAPKQKRTLSGSHGVLDIYGVATSLHNVIPEKAKKIYQNFLIYLF